MIQRREDQTLFEECPAGILISEREEKGKNTKNIKPKQSTITQLSDVCLEYYVCLQNSNLGTGLDISEI